MKETRKDMAVKERFRPGILSLDGFTGTDPRDVEEIIAADRAGLEACGTDAAWLVREMKRLRNAGRKGLEEDVAVPPFFTVRVETDRGLLVCPFGDSRSVAKTITTVLNTRTGRSAAFTDMNIHLIEHHGFFEGRGSEFRIDPSEICAVLEPDRKER